MTLLTLVTLAYAILAVALWCAVGAAVVTLLSVIAHRAGGEGAAFLREEIIEDDVMVGMLVLCWPAVCITIPALGICWLLGKLFRILGHAARRLTASPPAED